jgi:hypothetical protein
MTRRSDSLPRRLGASLAGLALGLQLVFAGWGMLAMAAPVDLADPFGGHALCLAGGAEKTSPGQPVPAPPAHDHATFCCLWHPLPGVQPAAGIAPLPVAYAALARVNRGAAPFAAGPRHNPANARAPPTLI